MTFLVLQYLKLENLLAEAKGTEGVRVYVLERNKTTSSNMLNWREITIGLCVRAITQDNRILSWYGEITKLGFYAHLQGNGDSSSEQEQYEAAWQRARELQTELAAWLAHQGYTVYIDGLIELDMPHFLHGVTDLIALPKSPAMTPEAT
ncbi:MAG: hypothetical protein KBA85_05755 [Chloroflexi bacterium]|nr:hypothetical protein [Chloroflexota bacterium]